MDKQSIIDKYIAGKLSEEEIGQFEVWMKEDANFKQEVEFLKNLEVVAGEDEKKQLKSRLESIEKRMEKPMKKKILPFLLGILVLLLVVAAYLGFKWKQINNSPEGIYASLFEAYPNIYYPVTRGKTDLMTRAFLAYENGAYSEAADLMGERLETSNSFELKFYQAISYASIGNLPLAIKNLEDIRRFDSQFLDEAHWYLGLFYLKLNDYDAAIARLQTFYELSNDAELKEKAKEIIYMLKDIRGG